MTMFEILEMVGRSFVVFFCICAVLNAFLFCKDLILGDDED
jgi:hypothetical protein